MGGSQAARLANILVIVALGAMLIGAVLLLLARDEEQVRLEPDATEIVLEHSVPAWEPWDRTLRVRVFGPANVTLHAQETSGTEATETNTSSVARHFVLVWEQEARGGESWRVEVTNEGNETILAGAGVTRHSHLWVGGALAGFGLVGFVFFRVGMRRAD